MSTFNGSHTYCVLHILCYIQYVTRRCILWMKCENVKMLSIEINYLKSTLWSLSWYQLSDMIWPDKSAISSDFVPYSYSKQNIQGLKDLLVILSMKLLLLSLFQLMNSVELQSFHLERLQVKSRFDQRPRHELEPKLWRIFQPLRDCLSLSMHHNQAHHDHCFAKTFDQSFDSFESEVEIEPRSMRVKRVAGPVIRRSLLEFKESSQQKCSLPCQKQPLLVDKKKILDFLGLKWLSRQIQEWSQNV